MPLKHMHPHKPLLKLKYVYENTTEQKANFPSISIYLNSVFIWLS